MNVSSLFYVADVQVDRVLIRGVDSRTLEPDKSLGAFPSWKENGLWYIPLDPNVGLPNLLMTLRDKGLLFLDLPAGWPPAAVFAKLAEEGKVTGGCRIITFFGGGNYRVKEPK